MGNPVNPALLGAIWRGFWTEERYRPVTGRVYHRGRIPEAKPSTPRGHRRAARREAKRKGAA